MPECRADSQAVICVRSICKHHSFAPRVLVRANQSVGAAKLCAKAFEFGFHFFSPCRVAG
jgi:hypothetical protein